MNTTHFYRTLGLALSLSLVSFVSHAATTLQHLPAPNSFTIAGAGLPDGRFVIYNGDAIFYQNAPGTDAFTEVASGYAGDPSFLAVSPSGATLLLGAGGFGEPYTGNIYSVNAATPQNFTPAAIETNIPHYAAVFLTETLVLIDAGAGDFVNSKLEMIDLNSKSNLPITVLVKPAAEKQAVVNPKPGYSASLAYDIGSGRVYAMDAAARELRYFSASALIAAFNGNTLLNWNTDGTLVGAPGDYVGGGAAGVTTQGYVVLGGSLGFTGPGSVQVVNPLTGEVINALDPVGDSGYTNILMNSFTGTAVVQQTGQNFLIAQPELITPPPHPQVPVAGGAGLLALAAAMAFGGSRILRRN